MTAAETSNPPDETIARSDLERALEVLGTSEQAIVLGALDQILQERSEAEEQNTLTSRKVEMVAAYKRIIGDNPRSIEGWFQDLALSSEKYLDLVKGTESTSDSETASRLFAAQAWVAYGIYGGHDPAEAIEVLSAANVDIHSLTALIWKTHPDLEDDDLHAIIADGLLEGAYGKDYLSGDLVGVIEADLLSSGVELPVLGDDGLYDEERDE